MTRLPPAEKLPLTLRKNIRDEWESKKPGFEADLSKHFGVPWTIDIQPNAIFPYGTSDWARESLGSLIADYVSSFTYQLDSVLSRLGPDGLTDLNAAASKHVLGMDVDENSLNPYCSVNIADGKLFIVFHPDSLGINSGDALSSEKLTAALQRAEAASGVPPAISFAARSSIRKYYDAPIAATQKAIATVLGRDTVTLVPNFESVFAALQAADAASPGSVGDWEANLGSFAWQYFDGVRNTLVSKGFGSDELLQEGFNEAVPTATIELRIVDALTRSLYCEVAVADGKLYVQTTAARWGTNMDDAASDLIDLL